MGLMDKLKAVKSNLTGDWASVTIQFDPVGRGGTLQASTTVTVNVPDASSPPESTRVDGSNGSWGCRSSR